MSAGFRTQRNFLNRQGKLRPANKPVTTCVFFVNHHVRSSLGKVSVFLRENCLKYFKQLSCNSHYKTIKSSFLCFNIVVFVFFCFQTKCFQWLCRCCTVALGILIMTWLFLTTLEHQIVNPVRCILTWWKYVLCFFLRKNIRKQSHWIWKLFTEYPLLNNSKCMQLEKLIESSGA